MRAWFVWMLSLAVASSVIAQDAKDAKGAKETKDVKTVAKFYYAKVTDRTGQDEYRVLSDEEFKSLQEEISAEGRCFARAMLAAEAEWRKGEDTKKKSFPRSAVKPRKVAVLQTFNDRAAADKKYEAYLKREASAAEKDKLHAAAGGGGSSRTKEQQAADAADAADRRALDDRARSAFEGKLAEMIAGAKKTGEAAPAPAPDAK